MLANLLRDEGVAEESETSDASFRHSPVRRGDHIHNNDSKSVHRNADDDNSSDASGSAGGTMVVRDTAELESRSGDDSLSSDYSIGE